MIKIGNLVVRKDKSILSIIQTLRSVRFIVPAVVLIFMATGFRGIWQRLDEHYTKDFISVRRLYCAVILLFQQLLQKFLVITHYYNSRVG